MPLTDVQVKSAKPADKPQKLSDEKGLYLLIAPTGGKWWRFKYRAGGKEKLISFGTYPEVSLREARDKRDEARKVVAAGGDPGEDRKQAKRAAVEKAENSFEVVGREWHKKHSPKWKESHSVKLLHRLEREIFPYLGAKPICDIEAPEILKMLRAVEDRGIIETAHRVHQLVSQVMRYAIATGRATRNPAGDLHGALTPIVQKHHASITEPKAVGDLLRTIEGYQGSFLVKSALRLGPLVFVRPGELRRAEWAEIDLEKAEWRIPGHKMKMREQHIVPLSSQAVAVLMDLQPLTGGGQYLFPGERSKARPMSENTVNAALRRMGYAKDEMTGHGFRSMASTLLNELGWHGDAVERQLAHAERDGVRAAYNYAEHLPERRRMMQAWADYLDGLKAGGQVIAFRREAG